MFFVLCDNWKALFSIQIYLYLEVLFNCHVLAFFETSDILTSNFIQKVMGVVDLVAPIKSRGIKQNSQEWFDGEVAEKKSVRDKWFKKFKKSKFHIDKEIYKIARYEVQKLISYKKKKFFENRLNDSIGKPKELWKALKSLGLPSKTSVCGTTALKVKNTTSFETKSTLDVFKNYYSTLAVNLLKKLPTLLTDILLTL